MTGKSDEQAEAYWWERRVFAAALVLCAFVPLLYPPLPPLVDALGHMGRYRVELDLAHSPELQRFFDFHWRLIGNLGVDLLVYPLGKLIGLEPAVKLIAILIPPLTVTGMIWVAMEVHHRLPPTLAFALPFAFSHPFLFGFLNFTLSMALALLAFGLWLRLGRLGRFRLRGILFVPISFLVFVCHTFGWGTLGLMCFSAEAVRLHDRGEKWWKSGVAAALHAAVMAGPLLLMLLWRSRVDASLTFGWFDWGMKAMWLLSALRDRWQWLDLAMVAVVLFVFVASLLNPRLALSRNLAFSALVLVAAFLALPWTVFGSAFADMRLLPYAMAIALVSIRWRDRVDARLGTIAAVAGTAFYLIKIAATTASMAIAADRQSAQLEALDHLPRGAALVSLVAQPCPQTWPLYRQSHLPAMATVRREAFANDQWEVEGANLLTVRFPEGRPFRADPSQMVRPNDCDATKAPRVDDALRAIPRKAFDSVWLIDVPEHDPQALRGYRLVWSGEGSQLYARDAMPAKVKP